VLPSTSAVGLTTEASAAWPNALGKLTRDLESVLGSKVVGLVRERTSKAVSAGLRWWLFGENADPADVELTVQMIRGRRPFRCSDRALDAYANEAPLSVAVAIPLTATVGEGAGQADLRRRRRVTRQLGRTRHRSGIARLGHVRPLDGTAQVLPRIVAMVNAIQGGALHLASGNTPTGPWPLDRGRQTAR
jgi:hypothetical protein